MSYNPMAYAVIGVRIPVNKNSFGQSRTPSCEHSFDAADANFCPKCGKPVAIVNNILCQFTDRWQFETFLGNNLNKDMTDIIVTGMSYEDDDDIFVGVGVLSSNRNPMLKISLDRIPPFDEIKMRLRNLLEPYGIYDDTSFGLYSIVR